MVSSTLRQRLLYTSEFASNLTVSKRSASHADQVVIDLLNVSKPSKNIGISHSVTAQGRLDFMCLADTVSVHLIRFESRDHLPKTRPFASLLAANNPEYPVLVGFQMARTAIQVSQTTKLRVSGVDLSRCFHPDAREPQSPSDVVRRRLGSNADHWAISCLWMGGNDTVEDNVCLQAWLAACIGAGVSDSGFEDKHILDTDRLQVLEKSVVARLVAQLDLFDCAKPWESVNDFSKGEVDPDGSFRLHNTRFKTRVRCSNQTRVILEDVKGTDFQGKAIGVKGKQTTIAFQGDTPALQLHRVRVVGREEPTNSEKACDSLVFLVLSGREDLLKSAFTTKVWFPQLFQTWSINMPEVDSSIFNSVVKRMQLNDSQKLAVESMVGKEPIVIVHGPPGTGKTTTIAATARLWEHHHYPTWIVAHSNVAVKNIAETLAKKEVDFQLVVSKEFYDEWHEHIYEGVAEKLIRSDEIPDPSELARLFGHCQIVLSTLSMLSNPVLQQSHLFKMVPMERLVIDEASQISIFEYLHIFQRFHKSLIKVCFFGDPQQLPPYGKDNIPSLQTIFDLKHLMHSESSTNVFLDTQYRMPSPIGNFISTHVYGKRLKSQHHIQTPDCLAFIDANKTGEAKAGKSTRNDGEIGVIVNLVENYYKKKDFCIITPYDAQRSAIQAALKAKNLPWESVFNLDSFQGNEAEYVLISVVRSSNPGFLTSDNRMNVLLTRCRGGMVIVSNREFLTGSGGGSSTLLGRLLLHWERHHNPQPWVDWRDVSTGTASLPGSNRTSPKLLQTLPVMDPFVPVNLQAHEDKPRLGNSSTARACSLAPSLRMTSGSPPACLDESTLTWPSLPSHPFPNPAPPSTTPRPKVKTAPKKESKVKRSASGFIRSITIYDSSLKASK